MPSLLSKLKKVGFVFVVSGMIYALYKYFNHDPPPTSSSESNKQQQKSGNAEEEKRERRTIKAVLFDLDGTLIDTRNIWFKLLNAAAKNFKCPPISYEEWKPTYGQSMESNMKLWFKGTDMTRVNAYIEACYADFINELTVLPRATHIVKDYFEHFDGKIGCVTNCHYSISTTILKKIGIWDQFEKNLACAGMSVAIPLPSTPTSSAPKTPPSSPSSENGEDGMIVINKSDVDPKAKYYESKQEQKILAAKPKTDLIDHICTVMQVDPRDCVLVGDSKFDMDAGKSAGCVTVGIAIDGGDARIEHIRELPSILELHPSQNTASFYFL